MEVVVNKNMVSGLHYSRLWGIGEGDIFPSQVEDCGRMTINTTILLQFGTDEHKSVVFDLVR